MYARLHAQLALSPSGGPRDLAARPRFRYIHVPGPGGGEAGARAWSRRYRPATHSRAAQPPGGLRDGIRASSCSRRALRSFGAEELEGQLTDAELQDLLASPGRLAGRD
jgi:hypothetical protein